MIKNLWVKWRAWASIDDSVEALIKKYFAAATAFEAHAKAKADELLFHNEAVVKAQALAEQARHEVVRSLDIASKVRAIFS